MCRGASFVTVYRACEDRRHWIGGTFEVEQCTRCGYARTRPFLSAAEVDRYYPPSYCCFRPLPPDTGFRKAVRRLIWAPFKLRFGWPFDPLEPERGRNRLLDVGCGTGEDARRMAAAGWETWGLEPDREAAAMAVSSGALASDHLFVGLAEEAHYPPGSFDLVTMVHVLEHVQSPRAVLERIHGWLSDAGRLKVGLPNFGSRERRIFGRLWFGLDVPRHLHHFDRGSVTRLLADCGFSVERVVAEPQSSTLSSSVLHAYDKLIRRRRDYSPPGALGYALLPVAAVFLALGSAPTIDVVARRS